MSRGAFGRWAAGLTPVVAGVWLLLADEVAASEVVTYAAYLVLAVLGPGILVARAVLGRAPLLLAELGVGGATGMVLQLGAWSLAMASGLDGHLRWWPVGVYGVFLLVPRLRRHWRLRAYPERLTPLVAWTLALSVVAAFAPFSRAFAVTVPLEGTNQWPADLYWHLGLVELFARQAGPEDSQVAGEHLAYHWFAHADIAGASLVTGIDPALLLSRLWVLPVVALTVAALVAALREVGQRGPAAAAVASVLVAAPAGLEVLDRVDVPWDPVFAPLSPSQNYSYPLLLLTVGLVVRYLRRGELRTLPPLAVLLLLSPGAKVSTLPVLLSGLALATAVAVLRRRSWQRPALLTAMSGAALVVGTIAIGAGGGTGARVQLLASLRRVPAFHESVGMGRVEASLPGGLLPSGLHVRGAWLVLSLLLLATAVKYAWVAPGLPLLRARGGIPDPVPWVLAGGGLAGWLLMLLVDHSGLSQVYFMTTGTVLWAMLGGWGTVALLDRAASSAGRRATTRWAVCGGLGGVALGAGVVGLATAGASRSVAAVDATSAVDAPDPQGTALALAAGLLPLAGLLLGALLWVVAGRRRTPGSGVLRAVAASVAVVAASVALNPWLSTPDGPPPGPTRAAVSPAELEAARWIAERAGRHDVVATNVHCLGLRTRPSCDARAFWVSALTRRRTYVGGWAYLDQTRAAGGRDGLPPARQPFHDPERFALNQALFEAPTSAVAAELARRGVDWVYADHRRSPVSPELATVAELVHRTADVDVYRLPEQAPAPAR